MQNDAPKLFLRDLITLHFEQIERELSLIRARIDKMDKQATGRQEFDLIKFQVASLADAMSDLEQRVVALEHHSSVATWAVRQVITVVVIVIVIWLVGVLR